MRQPLVDRLDASLVVAGAAIRQVVAIYDRDHDVRESHPLHRRGQMLRLVRVGRLAARGSSATLQNRQPRVHSLPATMNVAVPRDQQSFRFGQRASSQTVCRPLSATAWCVALRIASG